MSLSKAEIELLRKLISYKGHVHWDVQNELLGHIVGPIEAIRENEPDIEIQEAFSRVFKKFSSKGFHEIEQTYQKQLEKSYYRVVWEEFKSFLRSFRVLILIALFALFYQFRHLFGAETGWILGLLGLFVVSFIPFYIFFRRKYTTYRRYAHFGTTQNNFNFLSLIFNMSTFCFILLNSDLLSENQFFFILYRIVPFALVTVLFSYLFVHPYVLKRLRSEVDLLRGKIDLERDTNSEY